MYTLIKYDDEELYVTKNEYGTWYDIYGHEYGFTTLNDPDITILKENITHESLTFDYQCPICYEEIKFNQSINGCCDLCDRDNAVGRWIDESRTLDKCSWIYYKTNNELQAILYYYQDTYKYNDSEFGIIYREYDYDYDIDLLHILDGKNLSKITEE